MFHKDQSVISNIVRTEITKVLQSAMIAQNIGIAKILLADCVFKREKENETNKATQMKSYISNRYILKNQHK
jgi:uncharacterized protein YqgQ